MGHFKICSPSLTALNFERQSVMLGWLSAGLRVAVVVLLKDGLLEKSIGSGSSGLIGSDADDVLTLEPTVLNVVMSDVFESL